jgi:PKD repeat protein
MITVSKRPLADFTFVTGCEDEIAVFTDISNVNGGGQIAAWNWNFGDPGSGVSNFSALQNPVHNYSASGNYTITLIIDNMNGCSDTLQKTI